MDIHTEEDEAVWEKTAMYMGFYGASYTGLELKSAFDAAMSVRRAEAGQSYECYPDVPFENILAELFRAKGAEQNADMLGVNAAQLFRILSIEYIRLYPGVKEALNLFRKYGFRLWLLTNAQHVFTEYELRYLGFGEQFDKIYISSDYGCRKPDIQFFKALLEEQKLIPGRCLMIGNDRETDIAGALNAGMHTLYMHTNLTPREQAEADLRLFPENVSKNTSNYEYEGSDWTELAGVISEL